MQQTAIKARKLGGKTAEERRTERWGQLIHAAMDVYGERGYRNATVKMVCDAAGLTERYFYESFANSEDLLCACFQEGADELLSQVRRAGLQNGGAPLERVRAGVLIYLKHLKEKPKPARVLLIEMSSVSARADALVSASLDRFGALLIDFLTTGSAGYQDPPPLLLRGAIGGGLQIAQAWIASGYAAPIEEAAATILKFYGLVATNIAAGTPETPSRAASLRRNGEPLATLAAEC